ncbi:Uncharacterised protein [Mycobacterium tuberculosis]|nr:Uncharacterised protein [Mycobacterium tuberculosis]
MPIRPSWICSIPTSSLPVAITSRSEKPACSTNTGSNSATAAAKAGSSANN